MESKKNRKIKSGRIQRTMENRKLDPGRSRAKTRMKKIRTGEIQRRTFEEPFKNLLIAEKRFEFSRDHQKSQKIGRSIK